MFGLEEAAAAVEVDQVREDASLGGGAVGVVAHVLDDLAETLEDGGCLVLGYCGREVGREA